MRAYLSNRVEKLYQHLKHNLFFNNVSPFTKRLVIVPSPAMKAWLMLQMANDPDLGIAAGIEVTYLNQALGQLLQTFSPHGGGSTPTSLELALHIEHLMRLQWMEGTSHEVWKPLLHYLGESGSRKGERRLVALSERLAHVFLQYEKYGAALTKGWESGEGAHWQRELWCSLFKELWQSFTSQLEQVAVEELSAPVEVHVFALSFFPRVYHTFLENIAISLPVAYYQLSPCQLFWSDVVSDRERVFIQKEWEERGVKEEQQHFLEEYLRDCNPLLANFGRLGREMMLQIEESGCPIGDDYVLPEKVNFYPQYLEHLTEEITQEKGEDALSLLEAIQADMVLLRHPSKGEVISLEDKRKSVRIHAASTPLREVEGLYDTVMELIYQHQITPADVLVLTPDITDYAPHICTVFGADESLINFQMMDMKVPTQSPLIRGFCQMLSLAFGRFEAEEVMGLLTLPVFYQKLCWTKEDLHQIKQWVKQSGVRWGFDCAHRKEILRRRHCEEGLEEVSSVGTWESAFERLLLGLAMTVAGDDDTKAQLPTLPCEGVENSQSLLLGEWISLLRALKEDLTPITSWETRTLVEWTAYLRALLETYFVVDPKERATEELFQKLDAFGRASKHLVEAHFPFYSIQHHLEEALNRETMTYRESHLNAVRFCSLLPMRAIPAKVVVLLGMHEGAFPKQERYDTFNLLREHPEVDYSPSQTDYDRYLFLETLLSARHTYILSYSALSQKEGKEQPPSILVAELMKYLDQGYTLNGQLPSEACTVRLPYHLHAYTGVSWAGYRAALSYYEEGVLPKHALIQEFKISEQFSLEKKVEIELKQLKKCAKNPLQLYFHQTLGLYLERASESEDKALLSRLEAAMLRNQLLKKGGPSPLKIASKEGRLPFGLFQEAAMEAVQEEANKFTEGMPEELFSINLEENPLLVTFGNTTVVVRGLLENISSKGVVILGKKGKQEILRAWPEALVLSACIDRDALPIEKQWIFAKDNKAVPFPFECPLEALRRYLELYFVSRINPSPLIPEWIPHFLKEDQKKWEKVMHENLNGRFQYFYNQELLWGSRGVDLTVEPEWIELAKQVFADAPF